MPASAHQVSILSLVERVDALDAELPLALAHGEFARRKRLFLAVVSGARFVGLASGHQVNETLGAVFGHAFFGRSALRNHVKSDALVTRPETVLTELIKQVSSRENESFFEDIAVVSEDGAYVGLISVHRLVRLQTSMLLENLEAVESQRQELSVRNRQMEDDLRMAREVQLAILPEAALQMETGGRILSTDHFYEPSELIGGDFFAYTQPSDTSVGMFVCDVMGHGVRSALITTIVSALVNEAGTPFRDPGQLLTRLNRHLRHLLEGAGTTIFVTAAYAVVDLADCSVSYAQAGHPPAVRWNSAERRTSQVELRMEAEGPALGLLDDFEYASDRLSLEPGDRLMLYTDGAVEAAAASGEEFGTTRLQQVFEEAVSKGTGGIAGSVAEAARSFSAGKRFTDDVCVLVARIDAVNRENLTVGKM